MGTGWPKYYRLYLYTALGGRLYPKCDTLLFLNTADVFLQIFCIFYSPIRAKWLHNNILPEPA